MFMETTPFITVRASRPLSEIEFCAWVAQAVPGDRLEYHRGFLVRRRLPDVLKAVGCGARRIEQAWIAGFLGR